MTTRLIPANCLEILYIISNCKSFIYKAISLKHPQFANKRSYSIKGIGANNINDHFSLNLKKANVFEDSLEFIELFKVVAP